jgi:AcrR family transcriptional regulator
MSKRETKTQILAAATSVFAQKGFAGASMNDIVRAAGLSKGGVYWHFKSKDAIIMAIFDQHFGSLIAQLDQVLAEDGPAATKLMQLVEGAGQQSERWVAQFPWPMEFYALAARDEALNGLMARYFRAYGERLVSLVKQGIAEGEFRAVDPADTVITLEALFEGILLLWAMDPTQFDLSRQVERSVRLLLEGLQQ